MDGGRREGRQKDGEWWREAGGPYDGVIGRLEELHEQS